MKLGINPIKYGLCAMLLLSAGAANGAIITIFGEDLAPVAGTPPTNTPVSRAAQTNFNAAMAYRWTYDAETPFSTPTTIPFRGPSGILLAQILGDAIASSSFDAAAYATSGINVVGGTETWTLNFRQPIYAIGMFGIAIPGAAPQESQIRLEITFTNGDVELWSSPNTLGIGQHSVFFFGVVDLSRSFQQVRFLPLASTMVQIAVDDITVGTRTAPVSEPASVALILLGLGSAVTFRSRRQRVPRT